jgi:hypothetical protein
MQLLELRSRSTPLRSVKKFRDSAPRLRMLIELPRSSKFLGITVAVRIAGGRHALLAGSECGPGRLSKACRKCPCPLGQLTARLRPLDNSQVFGQCTINNFTTEY